MARTTFLFWVDPSVETEKHLQLVEQWPERTRHLQQQIPYLAARLCLRNIRQRIPKTEGLRGYRMALEVCRIYGLSPREFACAVRLNPKHRKVRSFDATREILYIRPRRRLVRTRPEIEILERFSPWTYETIPFLPPQSQAFLKAVKVGRRKGLLVQKLRRKDRRKWQRELAKIGFLNQAQRAKSRPKFKYREKVPPIVLEAISMEFGLDKEPTPHWGPGIRRFLSVGVRSLRRRYPGLTSTLTQLEFRTWRKWPTQVRNRIHVQKALGFVAFQKKLGIRAAR